MNRRAIPDESRWRFDRHIPIALLLGIGVQTAVIVWWASGITERVTVLERNMALAAPNSDRLTRVEVKLEGVQDGIIRIERLIQQKPPR